MATACPICNYPADRGYRSESQGAVTRATCPRCGRFEYTDSVEAELARGRLAEDRWRLSAATRRAWEDGRVIRLATDTLDATKRSVRPPDGPLEGVDRLLLWLAKRQPFHAEFVPLHPDEVSAVLCVPNADTAAYYLEVAKTQLVYLETRSAGSQLGYRLTMPGWKRHREVVHAAPDSVQAFVAMSFADGLDAIWEEGLRPGIEEAGYKPFRTKEQEHSGKIDDLIIREMRRSSLVVADFTEQKQNVYYEAGFADGLGLPVVRCVRAAEAKKLHFDTRQYAHVTWTDADDLRVKIRNRIEATAPVGRRVQSQ